MGKKKNLHIIPIIFCVLCPLTFTVTYIFAVRFDHVSPAFPYISDTGTKAPESCIFSQFLNVAALLMAMCVYIRHLQVTKYKNFRCEISQDLKSNNVATTLGFLSCLGMDIVANFQVTSPVWPVHYFGALLAFWGGTAYFVFQTVFSYHMAKVGSSTGIFYCRCVLCLLCVFFNITAIIPGVMAKSVHLPGTNPFFWKPTEDGFVLHVVSTGSEWLLAVTQSSLVLTFLPEFRPLVVFPPLIEIQGLTEEKTGEIMKTKKKTEELNEQK